MSIVLEDVNLRHRHTFGMDVYTRRWIEADNERDVVDAVESTSDPTLFIGAGSNMLFCESYRGTLIHNSDMRMQSEHLGSGVVRVEVGAGMVMDRLAELTAHSGLRGLENLSGIPGEAGAGAVQNVGAYGTELADAIEYVRVYDFRTRRYGKMTSAECDYGYRHSLFKDEDVKGRFAILSVAMLLRKDAPLRLDYGGLRAHVESVPHDGEITPAMVRTAVLDIRRGKLPDPAETGSAGSFFKNPVVEADKAARLQREYPSMPTYPASDSQVKIPAAWLIDQCGWKGYGYSEETAADAAIWPTQPLVIVNRTGRATPADVLELERRVTESVEDRFGIRLVPEVEHVYNR